VDEMLRRGLIEEARAIAAGGMSATARQALGYRQVLEAGPATESDGLRRAIVTATRRFARRQRSWFRSDPRVQWFDAASPGLVQALERFFTPLSLRP